MCEVYSRHNQCSSGWGTFLNFSVRRQLLFTEKIHVIYVIYKKSL
jgi:hypothetical protein